MRKRVHAGRSASTSATVQQTGDRGQHPGGADSADFGKHGAELTPNSMREDARPPWARGKLRKSGSVEVREVLKSQMYLLIKSAAMVVHDENDLGSIVEGGTGCRSATGYRADFRARNIAGHHESRRRGARQGLHFSRPDPGTHIHLCPDAVRGLTPTTSP